jgi:hypothetical protein
VNAPTKILKADANVISAFLYILFAPEFVHAFPEAWIEVVCIRPDKRIAWRFFSAHDLKPVVDYVVKMNSRGCNCYVGAALRHGEKPADGERAGKKHFCAASHFWADCDDQGCYEHAVDICKREQINPSMVNITGTTPHTRAQIWIKSAQPITDSAELETGTTALRDVFGSDNVQNADRIMRIPGTVNFPSPGKIERGYTVELTTLQTARDAPTYSVEALCDLRSANSRGTNSAAGTGGGRDGGATGQDDPDADPFQRYVDEQMREAGRLTDGDMQALLEKHQNGGGQNWHNDLLAVTWELLRRGNDPFAIQMVIGSACKRGFDDPDIGRLVNKKWEEFQAERLEAESAASAPNVPSPRFLTLEQWRERDLPKPDYLLGEVFSTTSRGIMSAPTGLRKTNYALALGMRMAAGMNFLHWEGRRRANVLYIDGEMSRRLLKQRLLAEETRLLNELSEQVREQFIPDTFHALSTEDIPNFQPLNTRRGQAAIEKIIAEMGGCDFVIFDNVMSLIAGSMVDEEAWSQTLPWVKSLTKRGIGQLWVHHTGHDESKGYGTKTREWQMDVVIHLAKAERADTDVSFKLEFRKARERRPDNRADFQEVNISLVNDQWACDAASGSSRTKVSPMAMKFLEALLNVVGGGETSKSKRLHGCHAPHSDDWKTECELLGLLDPKGQKNVQRALFSKYRRELVAANKIGCEGEHAWLR